MPGRASGGLTPPFNDPVESTLEGDEFIVEVGSIAIERRLTRQQKLRRGGLAALAVMLAAFFLLGGPSTTLSLLGSLQMAFRQPVAAAKAPPRLDNVAVDEIRTPPNTGNNLTVHYSPANGPDGYLYACWTHGQLVNQTVVHSLHVALWTNATSTWTSLSAPVATASICTIATDHEREQSALLAAWPTREAATIPCELPQLFYTNDAGGEWSDVPWPADAQPACDLSFSLEAGRLYVGATTPLLSSNLLQPTAAAGFLLTTDTGFIFWRADDGGQAGDASFRLLALRPGGKLLAESLHDNGQGGQEGALWESEDTGAHWTMRVALPGNALLVSVSSDPMATDHGGWGYLYASFLSEGTGGGQQALAYGDITLAGSQWTPLALPESSTTLPGRPMANLLLEAAEGPLESLLYLLPDDSGGRALSPLYFPWFWDTARGGWLLNSAYLPANTIPQGISWNNGAMTFIYTVVHQGVIPATPTFTSTITPDAMRHPG